MNKIRVGIVFGGQSAEHEVSIQSARNVFEALDKEKYEVLLIGIDKRGSWHFNLSQQVLTAPSVSSIRQLASNNPLSIVSAKERNLSNSSSDLSGALLLQNKSDMNLPVDVIFPVLHGPRGEDGTIQGLFTLANIPFVGAGVLGSAVGMDKDVMKRLLRDANIPITKFIVLHKDAGQPVYEIVKKQLGVPFFVKPANLGSTIGVSKVHDETEFAMAIQQAFQYDTKIIVEEAIIGRELECSVLGNETPIASVAGEIKLKGHEYYDYEAKYIDEDGADIIIPAELTKRQLADIQDLAVKTFKVLCCSGMARVDFFLSNEGKIYVNEINTIPGFTNISMYPKLWEASGITHTELVDRLITLAIERHQRNAKLTATKS